MLNEMKCKWENYYFKPQEALMILKRLVSAYLERHLEEDKRKTKLFDGRQKIYL